MINPEALSRSPNFLLASLSPSDAELLEPELEAVALKRDFVLERPQVTIDYIYFPDSGIGSIVAGHAVDRHVEVGLFGRDGMSGLSIVLGTDRSPHITYMQMSGAGQRMTSDALRRALERSPTLRLFLLRYVQAFMTQTAQTALANGRARLEERLCRWLLMCHDRADGDAFLMTHELLSVMLGVRRAGVTVAVHRLASKGLIRATRGRFVIMDRAGLEDIANGSYGLSEAEYKRLLG